MLRDHPPFFVLGAGFGVDAGSIVGPIDAESIYVGKYRFSCAYPLVRDLPSICFPAETPSVPVTEVERRMGEALASGDNRPIERLCEELSKADHYLAPPLVGWPTKPNPYAQFFTDFPASSFATYNYDAFVEFALFRAGRWFPHDGFGVRVAADLGFTAEPHEIRASKCLVLHLHGTYMVYTHEHTFGPPDKNGVQWIELYDSPRFAFDPYALGQGFYPFERSMAGFAYSPDVHSRVVAPTPDKATGLKAAFIREVSERAKAMVAAPETLVAIGYAFAPNDSASHSELLEAFSAGNNRRVVVVSPDASGIVARLQPQYTKIKWTAVNLGFAEWVRSGYPDLIAFA
jgi:hypothetical protein